MKLFSKTLIAAALVAGFAAHGAMAADAVATVNGKAIPQAYRNNFV